MVVVTIDAEEARVGRGSRSHYARRLLHSGIRRKSARRSQDGASHRPRSCFGRGNPRRAQRQGNDPRSFSRSDLYAFEAPPDRRTGGDGGLSLAAAEPLTQTRSYGLDVWNRLRRTPGAIAGLIIVVVLVLAAIFAPLLPVLRSPRAKHCCGRTSAEFRAPTRNRQARPRHVCAHFIRRSHFDSDRIRRGRTCDQRRHVDRTPRGILWGPARVRC